VITKEYLASPAYEEFMTGGWDARHNTPEVRAAYGVWRWQGIYDHRALLLRHIKQSDVVVDFGGALGPLGMGSVCVDMEPHTVWGMETLSPVSFEHGYTDGHVDMIFTSHCLEHLDPETYKSTLSLFARKLRVGGFLWIHGPGFRDGRQYWHPDVKPEHHRIFAITNSWPDQKVHNLKEDLPMSFAVALHAYVGDASLICGAIKWQ